MIDLLRPQRWQAQEHSETATMEKRYLVNLLVGLILTSVVTLPTLTIVLGDSGRPSFSPQNAWAWLASWCILAVGFVISLIGLIHRVHWGHVVWSQTVLSFLVLLIYIGWYRRELDYIKMGPDPDAIDQGPPIAAWQGFLFLLTLWLVVGFFPLALKGSKRWLKARKRAPGSGVAASPEQATSLPGTSVGKSPSQAASPDSAPILKQALPLWLGPGLKLYGLVAYPLASWMLGLRFSLTETILVGGLGYVLAVWGIGRIGLRSTRPHPGVIIAGFLLLHACLACVIDMRLAAWLIWSVLKLKQILPRWPAMTAQFIGRLANLAIMVTSGIVTLLMGFRVIGPKPGQSQIYDLRYRQWIKHFRWIGPLIIATSIFGLVAKTFVLGI